jgi:ribosomal protein S6--L-glutamate ligase
MTAPPRSMKIAILSLNAQLYSTERLVEAGRAHGHEMRVINYLRCYMDITARRPMVMYQGQALNDFDAVIPRIGASRTFYGTAVVRQFEMMNVFTAVESQAISRSRDKLRSLQILASAGVDMPVTSFAHHTKDSTDLIEIVGGAPLVIKLLEGTQGLGVVLAETKKAAQSVIEAFRGLDANILVQEFVKEAKGEDVRAFVIGRRVVAAMCRQAPPGEFRSNLHRGGTADSTKLTPTERKTAIKAASTLGLKIAGVDMVRSEHGPLVLEVNSSPGLEGIEVASGKDVAAEIIKYVEKHARPAKRRRGTRY